ncbi:hypothetical protein MTBPR1_140031 [Candidatus Terasakiella magnetica]|uniref:Initiator Rep protein domain-containing protein n=1 Tax=Candidatus Terasakiella magnetica TaxID=1867952 RepID=A0A1C3RF41_9PROT|nr:replication initiation protein [Candidatus Terasakiella magnetica]SCA55913.1 hypothetical protein MTBPR1_140031 [Candidatus Terasakiella magnetica]
MNDTVGTNEVPKPFNRSAAKKIRGELWNAKSKPSVKHQMRLMRKVVVEGNLTKRSLRLYDTIYSILIDLYEQNGDETAKLDSNLIPVPKVMEHCNFDRLEELESSLDELAEVQVEYKILNKRKYEEVPGQHPLIGNWEHLRDTKTLRVEIPSTIGDIILSNGYYAYLSFNAIPKFKTKYAMLLYPNLVSDLTDFKGKSTYDIDVLKQLINWPVSSWGQTNNFKKKIKDAVKDISNNSNIYVAENDIDYEKTGNKTVRVKFKVTQNLKNKDFREKRIEGRQSFAKDPISFQTMKYLSRLLRINLDGVTLPLLRRLWKQAKDEFYLSPNAAKLLDKDPEAACIRFFEEEFETYSTKNTDFPFLSRLYKELGTEENIRAQFKDPNSLHDMTAEEYDKWMEANGFEEPEGDTGIPTQG